MAWIIVSDKDMAPQKYYEIGADGQDHSVPCTTKDLSLLFAEAAYIHAEKPLTSGDELIQAGPEHLNDFLCMILKAVGEDLNVQLECSHDIPRKAPIEYTDKLSNKRVTSVQTWTTAKQWNAHEWAEAYFKWLGFYTKGLIKVDSEGDHVSFRMKLTGLPLLVLEKQTLHISDHISEWEIKKGILNGERKSFEPAGRFWFLETGNSDGSRRVFTALTHFKPALPWYLYIKTQGLIHPRVMNSFGRAFSK